MQMYTHACMHPHTQTHVHTHTHTHTCTHTHTHTHLIFFSGAGGLLSQDGSSWDGSRDVDSIGCYLNEGIRNDSYFVPQLH